MNKLLLTDDELQVVAASVDTTVKALGAIVLKNPHLASLYAKLEQAAQAAAKRNRANG